MSDDRLPHPTADAYERACAALEKLYERAQSAEAERDRLRQDPVEMSGKHRQAAKDRDEARDELLRKADLVAVLDDDVATEQEQVRAAVYVVMIQDRHADPEPYVFSTAEAAIAYARQHALEYASSPDDVEEEPVDGWLYHARYSGESDSVWVIEKELWDAP